jgi:hypothetical protein
VGPRRGAAIWSVAFWRLSVTSGVEVATGYRVGSGWALRAALTLGVPLLLLVSLIVEGSSAAKIVVEFLAVVVLLRLVARRPAWGILVLVVFLPVQQVLLAGLFRIGFPLAVVRALGGLKETLCIGLALAALSRFQAERRRLDLLDGLVIAYLGLLLLYVFAPYVVPGQLAAVSLSVRALAFRDDGLFAVAFLAARHVGMTARDRRRVLAGIVSVGVLTAATVLFEYFATATWNRFLIDTLQVPRFKLLVLGVAVDPTDAETHGMIGSHAIIRVAGLSLSPLTVGFILLLPYALALQSLVARRVQTSLILVAGVCGAAVIVTLTRSAIIALLIVTVVLLRQGFRRLSPGRTRLMLGAVLVAVVLLPLAGSSTPVQRIGATFSSSDQSTTDHRNSLQIGLDTLRQSPLGLGLGTAPAIGDRFNVAGRVTSENAYLQVGNEVGIETMAVFLAMLAVLLVRLRRAAAFGGADGAWATAAFAAGSGLAIGGLFLHIWADFPTAVVFWAVGGLCIGAYDRRPSATGPRPPGAFRVVRGRYEPAQIGLG